MKILEKKEMQNIQGGVCFNNGDGSSSCYWTAKDGTPCSGTWTHGGREVDYNCPE